MDEVFPRKLSIQEEAHDITKSALDLITEIEQKVEPEPEILTKEQLEARELKKQKRKRYQENKKRKWFDTKENPYIYVSGLPTDVSESELHDFFKKCGVFKLDPLTGQDQIKLYRDTAGVLKGDARIGFAKHESVETAIQMLD